MPAAGYIPLPFMRSKGESKQRFHQMFPPNFDPKCGPSVDQMETNLLTHLNPQTIKTLMPKTAETTISQWFLNIHTQKVPNTEKHIPII